MCIIGIKPRGVVDFRKETFKNCWEGNSDGAGYAWYEEATGLWQVRKGFMKLKDFIEAYRSHNFDKNVYSVFHFRNTTAGKTSQGNCHPFPIIEDLAGMQQTKFACEAIAFHNGTVGKGDDKYSDTMYHVREFIAPLLPVWDNPLVVDKILFTILDKTISRWLLCVKGNTWRFGKWHDDKEGHSFSNEYFDKKKVQVIYYSSGYGNNWNNYKDSDPPGQWTSGSYQGKNGFWQGGKFTSWQDWYAKKDKSTRGSLPQSTTNVPTATLSEVEAQTLYKLVNNVKTQDDFENRYLINHTSMGGKFVKVMDWRQFARDQAAVKVINTPKEAPSDVDKWAMGLNSYSTNPDESPVDTKGKPFGTEDTLVICPYCFETEYIMDSEFSVGDTQCMKCGCVFTESSGEIHLFDHEIHKSYRGSHV